MSAHLDNTYGATFIGMVFAAILYGISCVQALHYYTNHNDSWHLKLTVAVVMILDTAHQALIARLVYMYTITYWGDTSRILLISRWSVSIELIFTGGTASIVQSFLTMRIWRLSGRNIYITGVSAALVTSCFVALINYIVKALRIKEAAELHEIKGASISVNALSAAADVLIAATLCILLNTSRTGFRRSEAIINKLMVFTVTTGLPTCLCALASLISVIVSGNTYIFTIFSSCLGCLYTNTLLATLNARKIDSEPGTMDISTPFRDFHPNVTNRGQNVSINIDMAPQKYHPSDDKKLEENSGLPYESDEGSSTRKVSSI